MSSGDLTKFTGIESLCNIIPSKDSSMTTLKKKMDAIRNTTQIDSFGNITLPSYFGIVLPYQEDGTCMSRQPLDVKTNITSKYSNPILTSSATLDALPIVFPISPPISIPPVDAKVVKFQFGNNARVTQTFLFTSR
jgi:hypothetical protein